MEIETRTAAVLLLDEDRGVGDDVRIVLRQHELILLVAETRQDALTLLATVRFDAVVLSLSPLVAPWDFMRQLGLHHMTREVPAIFVCEPGAYFEQARQDPRFHAVLRKPLPTGVIVATIVSLLGEHPS